MNRRPKMLGEFQEKHDVCGEPVWIVGSGKKAREECGCEPAVVAVEKVRRITHASARRKGRKGESETVKEWQAWGFDAGKTAASGAAGSRSNDAAWDTDVVARAGDLRVRVESKRLGRVAGLASMQGMLSRSDVLRVCEDGGKPFYFMSAEVFSRFAALAAEAKR